MNTQTHIKPSNGKKRHAKQINCLLSKGNEHQAPWLVSITSSRFYAQLKGYDHTHKRNKKALNPDAEKQELANFFIRT